MHTVTKTFTNKQICDSFASNLSNYAGYAKSVEVVEHFDGWKVIVKCHNPELIHAYFTGLIHGIMVIK